jgi:Major tropism determinant N-terminal domain
MATKIQLRRDYAANWQATNPVLSLGEPGVEIDTHAMKIGDGSTAWNELAYIQTSGDTENVTENMFVKINGLNNDGGFSYSGTVSTSTDGLYWTPSTWNHVFSNNQEWDIFDLAVGGGRIVYVTYEYTLNDARSPQRYSLRWAHNPFEIPQLPTSDNTRRGPKGENIIWKNVRYVGGFFVAVGYYFDSTKNDFNYPVAVYSTDGDNWTNVSIDLTYINTLIAAERTANSNDVTGLSADDVAYGNGGWLFAMHWQNDSTNINRTPAGAFYVTNLTIALNNSTRIGQIPGAYVAHFDGHGWVAYANYDAATGGPAAYFNSNSDPRMGSWSTVDLRAVFHSINGNYWPDCITDLAAGKLGDTNWIVFSDGQYGVYATSDQGATWKILQTTPEVMALDHVIDATPVTIDVWSYGYIPNNGEKVTIEGSPVAGLNGTFHTKIQDGKIELYNDVALTQAVASVGAQTLYVDKEVTGIYGDHTVTVTDPSGLVVGMISEGYNALTSWEDNNTGNDKTGAPNKIVSINGNNITMAFPWHGDSGDTQSIGFHPVMYRSLGDGLRCISYGDGAFVGMSYNNLERSYKTTDLNSWQSTTLGSGSQNGWFQTTNYPNSIDYGTVTTHAALMRTNSNTVPGYTNYLSLSDSFQLNVAAGDPQWTNDNLASSEGYGQGTIQIDPTKGSWGIVVGTNGTEGYSGYQQTAIASYNNGTTYQDSNHLHNSVSIYSEGYEWKFDNNDGFLYSQRLTVGDVNGTENSLYNDSVLHGIYFYSDDTGGSHSDQQNVERGIYVNNGQLIIDAAAGTSNNGSVQIGWDDDTNYTKVDQHGTTIHTQSIEWLFSADCNEDGYGVFYNPDSVAIQAAGYWKIGDYFEDWTGTYIQATDYSGEQPGDVEITAEGPDGQASFVFDRLGTLTFDTGNGIIQSNGEWAIGDYNNDDSYTYIGSYPNIDDGAYDIIVSANNTFWYFNRDGNLQLPPGGDIVDNDYVSVLGKEMPQNAVTSGNYTLQLTDRGKHIYNTGTGDVRIPTNASVAFPIGTVITLISGDNAFHLTAVDSGTTTLKLSNSGTTTSINIPADTYTTILKIATEKWIIERAS